MEMSTMNKVPPAVLAMTGPLPRLNLPNSITSGFLSGVLKSSNNNIATSENTRVYKGAEAWRQRHLLQLHNLESLENFLRRRLLPPVLGLFVSCRTSLIVSISISNLLEARSAPLLLARRIPIRASATGEEDSVVTLLDFGAGNVRSLRNAIRFLGFDVKDVQTPEDILKAKHLIFPGVGDFATAMDVLNKNG
nr:imidazole glycerol phosphate synthase hisHF, chloroplastic [Ipomoea batatas]